MSTRENVRLIARAPLPDVRNYPTLPYNFTLKTMGILKHDASY